MKRLTGSNLAALLALICLWSSAAANGQNVARIACGTQVLSAGASTSLTVYLSAPAEYGTIIYYWAVNASGQYPILTQQYSANGVEIYIPQGATSGSVMITANNVTGDITETMQAALANGGGGILGNVVSTDILVTPTTLGSITLSTTSVRAGQSLTGVVTLSHPGPAARTVYLSCNNPAQVSIPATVVVPAGKQSVTFTINTSRPTPFFTVNSVWVTASFGGNATKTFLRIFPY